MYRIVRHALAITGILYLESLAAESSAGRVPIVANPSKAAPVDGSRAAAASHQMGYHPERARALYMANCSACHGMDGAGRPGTYPPIKGSGVVIKDDATRHILVVLNGLQGAKAGGVLYLNPMPAFGGLLNDSDVADIIDYERSSWGNHGKLVTAAEVAARRGGQL